MELDQKSPFQKADYSFRIRYETLRALLNKNGQTLQILSDLEADLHHLTLSDYRIQRPVERLLSETFLMAQELNLLSRNHYIALYDILDQLREKAKNIIQEPRAYDQKSLAVNLDDEASFDPNLVGGKTAGLAALRSFFPESVPSGFTVTTAAYNLFLEKNKLDDRIRIMLKDLDTTKDRDRFRSITESIRNIIRSAPTPIEITDTMMAQAENFKDAAPSGWAVRSSATSEDSRFSFAGQFDSILNVHSGDLGDAYREVLAGRFTDRAVIYRINCGFREKDTPMAVLFMPMIDPVAAGVIYTTDPQDPDADRMVVSAIPGLGEAVVKGTQDGDTYYLSRQPNPILIQSKENPHVQVKEYLSENTLSKIGALSHKAMTALGFDMDIEWAVDKEEKIWLLQGRRLYPATHEKIIDTRAKQALPLIEGGSTIFPGRAEGPAVHRSGTELHPIPKGSVLVVNQPTPDLAPLLPFAAALVASGGSAVGHLATLVREFSIPSIFKLGNATRRLVEGRIVSVNATKRKIYEGSRWPGIKERVISRLASAEKSSETEPLHDVVLALHLTDPFSPAFKPKACRSIHDVIRFIHEMSVRQMFSFGDKHSHIWSQKTRRLKTALPIKIKLLDLENPSGKNDIDPLELNSIPFTAFWKGFSDPALSWPQRWETEFAGVPSDFREQVLGGSKGPRRRNDPNYLILARDYLNFNARFAYHYAMVDAFVGPGAENNYVHLRFHGGGGSDEKLQRRAKFVEWVLREARFGVDRRGDLVTAWMQRYPKRDSEEALETLGRLLVCARQLDLLMTSESNVKMFARKFLEGNYQAFS
jgi:pyruvate, water dikinase